MASGNHNHQILSGVVFVGKLFEIRSTVALNRIDVAFGIPQNAFFAERGVFVEKLHLSFYQRSQVTGMFHDVERGGLNQIASQMRSLDQVCHLRHGHLQFFFFTSGEKAGDGSAVNGLHPANLFHEHVFVQSGNSEFRFIDMTYVYGYRY